MKVPSSSTLNIGKLGYVQISKNSDFVPIKMLTLGYEYDLETFVHQDTSLYFFSILLSIFLVLKCELIKFVSVKSNRRDKLGMTCFSAPRSEKISNP